MDIVSIIGIAVALAMDAFAVSIAVGISLKQIRFRQFFRLSFHFGLFQTLMTVIGWAAGVSVWSFIDTYAHWIAFALLLLISGNMFRGAFRQDADSPNEKDATRGLTMVMLSIATSIDALAVGFSLSLLNILIALPAIIIGLVALAFTVVGLQLGRKMADSSRLSKYADIIGGIVLWGIGLNILYQRFF